MFDFSEKSVKVRELEAQIQNLQDSATEEEPEEEAPQDPIPEEGIGNARKTVVEALKKSSIEWLKSPLPRAHHVSFLLNQISIKITESKKTDAHYVPRNILNKLVAYMLEEFRFPHNDARFDLVLNGGTYGYKGLAIDNTVFRDALGVLMVKFRISNKNTGTNRTAFINLGNGNLHVKTED